MNNSYNIQEIRILPMDKEEEFKSEDDVRKYLAMGLIQMDGKYYFRERGLDINGCNVLVLFQYNSSIVGYGILNDIVKDKIVDIVDGKSTQYNGYFQFLTMTIHNVSNITLKEIQQIDNRVNHFSNPKWIIDMQYYSDICKLLLDKQIDFMKNKI